MILATSTPTSVRTVLPTNIPVEEAYIPGKNTTETQTGMSSVEAFPRSPKYLGASKVTKSTSMSSSEVGSTTTRKRGRDENCPHGIGLPVVEIQTVIVKEGSIRKKTTSESIFCIKCWRNEDASSDEDSDWGF